MYWRSYDDNGMCQYRYFAFIHGGTIIMKKKRVSKILIVIIGIVCICSLILPLHIKAQVINGRAEEGASVTIYPKPQTLKSISTTGMNFTGMVDLVFHGNQSDATITKMKEVLKQQNINYREANAVSANVATILISTDKEHCDMCNVDNGDGSVLRKQEGYILNATDDQNKNGNVTIVGADQEGAYYGVLSLEQLLQQRNTDGNFAEITVSDYPSIKLRGFVEGFYGYPWSFDERMSLIEDTSEYKMNTYIYAPKDDPYHKDKWRDPYPKKEAEELRQLAKKANMSNMSFCWNVHPGYGFNYNNDTDYNALINKFNQLYELGIRQFGISYDDLEGYVNGKQQANLINRVNKEFVKSKGDVKPLIVVGTRYCNSWGPSMNSYFKPFFSTLDNDVEVMWTGANTMAAINKNDFEWPKLQTGVTRNLSAWWNYPVNDYCDGNLMMSPLDNVDNDVDNLNGFFLNPMSQAEASKVAIYSGADYSWNVTGFEKMSSWKRAVKELVPDATSAFERFADNISYIKDGFEFDESRYFTAKIDALNSAIALGEDVTKAASAVKTEFETMENDVAILRNMDNKAMAAEIEAHVNAYASLAQSGVAAMSAFISAEKGHAETTMMDIAVLKEKLVQAETFTIKSLENNGVVKDNVVKVGEKRIKPMLRDAVVQAQSILMDKLSPSNDGSIIGNIQGIGDFKLAFHQGNYSLSDVFVVLKKKGTIGMKLPKAMNLSEITVTSANAAALELQYSLNGIDWLAAPTVIVDNVIKTQSTLSAAYVRIVNKIDSNIHLQMQQLLVKPVYALGVLSATTDLRTYQGTMGNTVDGNIDTQFYSSAGATIGSYARVDLGKEIPLFDASIYFAANPKGIAQGVDGFAETKMEISTDGANWKQIGIPIGYEQYEYVQQNAANKEIYKASFHANGDMARFIRFCATKASDNWVQIFEMPVNQSVNNLGDASVSLVDTTMLGGTTSNLHDGDLSSAYEPTSVRANDTLTYKLTTTTSVETMMIVQDEKAISNALVSIRGLDKTWVDIGNLDKNYNTFKIRKDIVEIKLTFDGNTVPKIYEIMATEWKKADFGKLQALIEKGDILLRSDLSNVIPRAVKNFENALVEAKKIAVTIDAPQASVDASEKNLEQAIQGLDAKKGNKQNLGVIIKQADSLRENAYILASWKTMQVALKQAKEVYNDENAQQSDVDSVVQTLHTAMNNLVLVEQTDVSNGQHNGSLSTNTNKNPDTPNTGDTMNTMGWMMLTIIIGGLFVGRIVYKKKIFKKSNQ